MNVGDEFWLVYHPSHIDGQSRRHVRMIEDEGDAFAVHDLDSDEEWSVGQSEIERGIVRIEIPDPFDLLMADVEFDMTDMTEVPDYTHLTMQQLRDRFNVVKDRLARAGHLFVQHTEEEKDLRAQYEGLLMEMRKRMMK